MVVVVVVVEEEEVLGCWLSVPVVAVVVGQVVKVVVVFVGEQVVVGC